MMPGAMTPLTISTFFKAIEFAFQDMLKRGGVLGKHYNLHKFLALQCNTGFINMHYTYGMAEVHFQTNDKRMAELSLMGETLDQITIKEVIRYWGNSPLYKRIINSFKNFMTLRGAHKRTLQWENRLNDFTLGSHEYSMDLYEAIDSRMGEYYQVWTDTFQNSASSAAWSTVLLSILSKGKPGWTVDHYSDVAMLLSKCEDVYSADVPSDLQKLADEMKKSDKAQSLIDMTAEDVVAWLKSAESGHIGREFSSFLDRQGHRCVREAELIEKSWKTEPVKVVRVVQAMLQTKSTTIKHNKTGETLDESIKKLRTNISFFSKQILKWVLPKARQAVGSREWGKSIAVQYNDIYKQAYWQLADMMVKEGYLPEEELLFFFTHKEIREVLQHRPGKFIARAQRRRRITCKQMSMKYPRLSFGHPKPIEETLKEEEVSTATIKLQGMPVSLGIVRGVCRVIMSLQDADSIQVGDILVVNYTDVGWSPYFPLISGLITEIGGLLSHGAVVAREYGLPCIVNVKRATHLFKTGDTVILDGTKGTIQKIEE